MLNLLNIFSLKRSPLLSQFHILLFHVLQFHALHIGPSISRPSFSRPAFSAPPLIPAIASSDNNTCVQHNVCVCIAHINVLINSFLDF